MPAQNFYPNAKFEIGDTVRFEQKSLPTYGAVNDIDLFKGMFLYTVTFTDGDTERINEAHLHSWNAPRIDPPVIESDCTTPECQDATDLSELCETCISEFNDYVERTEDEWADANEPENETIDPFTTELDRFGLA